MRFESRRGQNEENWKEMRFAIQKNVFSLLLFLAGCLALCLKDVFYNLKKRNSFTALFGWLFGFVFKRWFLQFEKT